MFPPMFARHLVVGGEYRGPCYSTAPANDAPTNGATSPGATLCSPSSMQSHSIPGRNQHAPRAYRRRSLRSPLRISCLLSLFFIRPTVVRSGDSKEGQFPFRFANLFSTAWVAPCRRQPLAFVCPSASWLTPASITEAAPRPMTNDTLQRSSIMSRAASPLGRLKFARHLRQRQYGTLGAKESADNRQQPDGVKGGESKDAANSFNGEGREQGRRELDKGQQGMFDPTSKALAGPALGASESSKFPGKLEEIVRTFERMPADLNYRNRQLIQAGHALPKMDATKQLTENLVHGCQSIVYVHPTSSRRTSDGRIVVSWEAASDGLLTRGLVYLLVRGLSGCTPAEVCGVSSDAVMRRTKLQKMISIRSA
eukprot:GHVT01001048.1.p1 GENE.GHVT01001048.1~~GHVT01001048.1.p1  ORF type:complete len:368 (+),score=22.08 GHVT01001048.1:310-1413(+)